MKRALLSTTLAIFLCGCGSSYVNMPLINFPYKAQEKSQERIGDTVSFAMVKPQIILRGEISSELKSAIMARIEKELSLAKEAANSQIQQTLLSKGISIFETYSSIEDMTYSQKKAVTGVFVPYVTIDLFESGVSQIDIRTGQVLNTNSSLNSKVKIEIRVVEPLAREKIWIKSPSPTDKTIPLNYSLQNIIRTSSATQIPKSLAPTAKSIDEMVSEIYKTITSYVDKYVSLQEFKDLNEDIKQLKSIKRY